MQEEQKQPEQGEATQMPGRVAVMCTKDILSYKGKILHALQRGIKPRAIRHTSNLTLAEYQAILNFKPE